MFEDMEDMEDMFEIYEVVFEIYIEDKIANKQIMQAPKQMLMINFIHTVKQIKNDKRPIMVKFIAPITIWDNFEKKQKTLNNCIEIKNDAMVLWEENKKTED